LLNFEAGGAAINALCKAAGAELIVVDVGTKRLLPQTGLGAKEAEPATTRVAADMSPIRDWRVRPGSANMARGKALELEDVEQAINLGLNLALELDRCGNTVVALGEMGIGNTTVASVLTAVFCGVTDPAEVAKLVGRGTGVDDNGLLRKRIAVERVLSLHKPDPTQPWQVLSQVGGLEIVFLAGLAIGAAAHRMAVVLDGFISTSAALVANALCPDVKQYLFASHRSVEPGHQLALRHLGLEPYLDLQLRLGEGSGAALALPLFNAATAIVNDMATFESAGVSGPHGN
jgi:nicotinate-nucleotide--dimethylbenzimidazole phosphoribosyltransferase